MKNNDLSYKNLDDNSIKDIIKTLHNYKKINLSHNHISLNGLYRIFKIINNTNIEEIDLSNNNIDSNGKDNIFKEVIMILNKHNSLKKLNLSYNNISSQDILIMVENMSDTISLKELNLCYQKNINENEIEKIIHFIYKKNPKVKIYLSSNKINDIIRNVKKQKELLGNITSPLTNQFNRNKQQSKNRIVDITSPSNSLITTQLSTSIIKNNSNNLTDLSSTSINNQIKNTKKQQPNIQTVKDSSNLITTSFNTKISNSIKNTKKQQQNIQTVKEFKNISIKKIYNELIKNSDYNKIILSNITYSFFDLTWLLKNYNNIENLVKNILLNKNIKELYIENSKIFKDNLLPFFDINKEKLHILNCGIKDISINNENINIGEFKITGETLSDNSIDILTKLVNDNKIKKINII